MRRFKVLFQPNARADLREIRQLVRNVSGSRATADAFVRRIFDTCERLGDVPFGGRAREDLQPGLRTFPFEKRAIIVYRVADDIVFITNVFYGGRDYETLLADPLDDADEPRH